MVQSNCQKEAHWTWGKYEHNKNLNKETENMKYQKEATGPKNTINELNNILEGLKSRLHEAEERLSDLEDRAVELTQNSKKKKVKR